MNNYLKHADITEIMYKILRDDFLSKSKKGKYEIKFVRPRLSIGENRL